MKFQRDAAWRLEAARKEGIAGGEARGRVRLLQELLKLAEAALTTISLEAFAALKQDLPRRRRERGIG